MFYASTHLLISSMVDGISPAALDPTLTPSVLLTARTKAEAAMVPYVSSGYTIDTRSVGWYLHRNTVVDQRQRFIVSDSDCALARNSPNVAKMCPSKFLALSWTFSERSDSRTSSRLKPEPFTAHT